MNLKLLIAFQTEPGFRPSLTTAASNAISGSVQTQASQFLPPYLPPQYGSVVAENLKNEASDLAQNHVLSYQSLQAVPTAPTDSSSLVNDGVSQLINVNQTTSLPPFPFLSEVHASNGLVGQNGISTTTQAFITSPEDPSKGFYVQVNNGGYQVSDSSIQFLAFDVEYPSCFEAAAEMKHKNKTHKNNNRHQ